MHIGTKMISYMVTEASKTNFLNNKLVETVDLSGSFKPLVECAITCLNLRNLDRFDFASCNGFIYEDNQCKLGYADLNWIAEQGSEPGTEGKIFFDISLP